MKCAYCGVDGEVSGSVRNCGVQQPRACKPCLIDMMTNGWGKPALYWIEQLIEAGDVESLKNLEQQTDKEPK